LTNKEKLDKYKEQRGEIAIKINQLQQRVRFPHPLKTDFNFLID
jgi:hypothetical protein